MVTKLIGFPHYAHRNRNLLTDRIATESHKGYGSHEVEYQGNGNERPARCSPPFGGPPCRSGARIWSETNKVSANLNMAMKNLQGVWITLQVNKGKMFVVRLLATSL